MSDQSKQLTGKDYCVIYGWLIGLTVLEVGVVMLEWPRMVLAILLVAAALAKTSLIVLFFMPLKFDKPLVWLLPGVPLALAIFFVGMLFPDIVFHASLIH